MMVDYLNNISMLKLRHMEIYANDRVEVLYFFGSLRNGFLFVNANRRVSQHETQAFRVKHRKS